MRFPARARIGPIALACVLTGAVDPVAADSDPSAQPPAVMPDDRSDAVANAEALLERSERLREAGELALAVRYARAALDIAPPGSDVAARARDTLYFHLPLIEIQRLIAEGRAGDAQELVRATLQENRDHPDRSTQLSLLLAQLAHVRADDPLADDVDTHALLREVRDRMRAFRRANGRYPASLRELDTVLPAGEGPLERFEVIHYRGSEEEYALALANRDDPQQVLTLQDTGLIR